MSTFFMSTFSIHVYIVLGFLFVVLFSCWLFKPDSTWGCVDQTRKWQDHHRLLHVTTDVAAALSRRQMVRRRLQLQSRIW